MPDIALKSTNASSQSNNNTATLEIENSIEQMTLPAATNMNEGTPVYINTSAKFANGDASSAGTTKFYGVTTRKVKAGEAVTAIAKGIVGGYDLSGLNFGADVFLSDTDGGRLSTAAGTNSKKIGEVVPVQGQTRGNSPAKYLRVMG